MSILPEWKQPLNISSLPPLKSDRPTNFFATWADSEADYPALSVSYSDDGYRKYLPYDKDLLAEKGLVPGNPVCYRSKRLGRWISHDEVFVLDMSTYMWSHSLKDPRSWAIVNAALNNGIRHLAVWTAGNAGMSLASIVACCNHHLPHDRMLQVYALFGENDANMDLEVQSHLRRAKCTILSEPKPTIYTPAQIKSRVGGRVAGFGSDLRNEEYWDVTDGWEAVGMIMYRLLAAQVIRDLQPAHIIIPMGTGNLALGFVHAVRDNMANDAISGPAPPVTAAIPCGKNILDTICGARKNPPTYIQERIEGDSPVMPKIAGEYAPLLPCIDYAIETGELNYVECTLKEQNSAANALTTKESGRRIVAEPSSVAAFAALPKISGDISQGERVLVVNSGNGLLSRVERQMMDKYAPNQQ